MKPNEEDSIFEIRNSNVNILQILKEIESQLPKKEVDLKDIQRISELNSDKLQAKRFRFFDPAHTAYLFEKGINPPKFSNPKFWFIKGPIRWLVYKLIDLYSLFDKKVSENRTKAFYNLVHEVMLLKQKQESFEEKFYELLQDYVTLKSRITKESSSNLQEIKNFYINPIQERIETTLFEKVKENKPEKILLLFPISFHLVKTLEFSNIPFIAITNESENYEFLKTNYTQNILFLENVFNWDKIQEFNHIIIGQNLSNFPSWNLQELFLQLQKHTSNKTQIYTWYKNSTISSTNPFQENFPTRIVFELLDEYFEKINFFVLNRTILEDETFLITIQKK